MQCPNCGKNNLLWYEGPARRELDDGTTIPIFREPAEWVFWGKTCRVVCDTSEGIHFIVPFWKRSPRGELLYVTPGGKIVTSNQQKKHIGVSHRFFKYEELTDGRTDKPKPDRSISSDLDLKAERSKAVQSAFGW